MHAPLTSRMLWQLIEIRSELTVPEVRYRETGHSPWVVELFGKKQRVSLLVVAGTTYKRDILDTSHHDSVETNLTSIHEDAGSIPAVG